ncbi:DNA polymerase V subunit UmuC [Klebsiella sp. RIT-PI-d]|uniref:translesion error-prone DNA polymerase V subunit UmuC n=1 Tax=Klebsiella sp. RIT-PI-d TaxID=1681196 RepID=UPI000675F5B8|nr:translesion error-prone DNA polymerase V subunit UmuC [Klebsiella sp. RIT-PI-d]KNC09605.1 DNA polymerase V subunit UmuC [Klebsiella sp. RIT-PI-d]
MFALVDVNSFYASCETVFRPDLKGWPVVVLSNNDGCVIARSAEAARLGIKMGEPYFKQRILFQQHRVAVFSSNYELYADMSQRVMSILEDIMPGIEIYSIDEAFCDLTGVSHCRDLASFGMEVQNILRQSTHLTVGVGIAPTKTLAKLANLAAKKWPQTKGVVDLSNPERQRKLMAHLSVGDVWGVGRNIAKKLSTLGIDNVLQLADADIRLIRKHFSVVLERTVRELRGESCLQVDEFIPEKQEIMCSRSFGERICDYPPMREAVCYYASRAAERMRGQHQYCRFISVFIKTSPFAPYAARYDNSASVRLHIPTHDTRDIIDAAMKCLDAIWREGHHYQKAGVMLSDFFSQGVAQLNLFDSNTPRVDSEALMGVMDKLNQKQGRGTLFFAGQGMEQQWQMKREMLSPRYTTRFSDLPRVRVR